MAIDRTTSVRGRKVSLTRRGGLVVTRGDGLQSTVGECVTVQVPTASVLALFATPYTLIAAQGAGLAIIPTRYAIHKPAGTAYGGIAVGEDLVLKYTNAAGAQCMSVIETTGFLDQATAQTRYAFPIGSSGATAGDVNPVANAALVLHLLTAEIITGTSDLYVRVWYDIMPTVFAAAS
jgi:hypothetical protein